MILGNPERRARAGGFTLVETLLVLAVMALLGTLLVPGISALLRSIQGADPKRIAWDVITAARARALESNRSVWLRFEAKTRHLTWDDGTKREQRELPAGVGVQFLAPKEVDRVLVGGVLLDTRELPAVRFYPDGTCDRFRLQLRQDAAAPVVVAVDSWTCAPMLVAAAQP